MDFSLKQCITAASGLRDADVNGDGNGNGHGNVRNRSGPTPMDSSIKQCSRTTLWGESLLIDRLTTLPIELLIRILSLLPTKDAASTSVLSKRMALVFPLLTNLDFDDSPISHCLKRPFAIERFPTFVTFVNSVLQSSRSQYLSTFRLRLGMDFHTRCFRACNPSSGGCKKDCFPDLKSTQINAWITFPLTRTGLRELDLRIHVRESGDVQLPSDIFTCETLEVLKLDVNLGLDQASTMPYFRLPNLKLLHFCASVISDASFVTRLVSSCPLLEDLTVSARLSHVHSPSISSTSLRRLDLRLLRVESHMYPGFVLINTPNLEDLVYGDNIARQYSIKNMDRLVKATICFNSDFTNEPYEVSTQQMLRLIRPLSTAVQHLYLTFVCMEILTKAVETHQLPVFSNLKHLELGYGALVYWHTVLLEFLKCSPILETLVFPEGISSEDSDFLAEDAYNRKHLELEKECSRTAQAIIPWCCRYNLKRIVIKNYFWNEREQYLIQFLLNHALVLEELTIFQSQDVDYPIPSQVIKSTLQNLPKASVTCSIQVPD